MIVVNISKETIILLTKKLLKSLFEAAPIVVSRHFYIEVANEISKLMNSNEEINNFDAVHFDHLDSSAYINLFPMKLKRYLMSIIL